MDIREGQKVTAEIGGTRVTGTVETTPRPFPGGDIVGVRLDPEHAHMSPVGSMNVSTDRVHPA